MNCVRCLHVVGVALLVALGLIGAAPGSATVARGRYALGDSVMLGAATQLRHDGYAVNAVESRQVADGVTVLRRLKQQRRLPAVVVIGLGTNGTFSRLQCRAMHRIAGPHRHLFVLTVRASRSWVRHDNRVIRSCARQYANTILIDWDRAAAGHPGWFYEDGIHLTPSGARAYANVVTRAVQTDG